MRIDKHQLKYKIVKFLLKDKILNLLNKTFLHVTEEYEIRKGFLISLRVEDLKNKIVIDYSIRNSNKNFERNRKLILESNELLMKYGLFNKQEYVEINLKEAPDSMVELNKWLEQFIF
jgi:hypothetical protein